MSGNPQTTHAFQRLREKSSRYRRLRSAGRCFRALVRLATPGVVAVLTVAFLGKLLWPPLIYAAWLLPAWVAGVGLYLLGRTERWRVSGWRADALTDLSSGNRGIYMAVAETGSGQWAESLRGQDVRLRAGAPVGALLRAGLLAALTAAVLLLPDLRPADRRPGGASRTPVKKLSAVVKELETEELADREYLESARQMLEELEERGSEGLDSSDWQALDSCRENLKKQAAESYRKLQGAGSEAARLSRQLKGGGELRPEDAAELADMTCRLAGAKGGKLTPAQAKKLSALACKAGLSVELSAKQLNKLLSACRSGACSLSAAQGEQLAALMQLSAMQSAMRGGKCVQCLGGMGFSEQEIQGLLGARPSRMSACSMPGRGGVDRGPGPARLEHVGDTDGEFGRFEPETFRGGGGEPEVSLGYTFLPPDEEDVDPTGGQRGPVREFAGGSDRITWHSRLLPRHNDVLKNYFGQDNPEGR